MPAVRNKPAPRIHEPTVENCVQRLELRQVVVIAARHAAAAQDELREERHVEADEDQRAGRYGASFSLYMRPNIFGHQ